MKISLRRRQLVFASSAAAIAPFGLARSAFAQSKVSVPAVDSLTIRVLIDSSYDDRRFNVVRPGVRGRTDRFIATFEKPKS